LVGEHVINTNLPIQNRTTENIVLRNKFYLRPGTLIPDTMLFYIP